MAIDVNNDKPIGIFDSGVGGLTILNELINLLPAESIEYFADSGNCPYGDKSISEIKDLSIKIIDYLINRDCKIIVVACNTITTNLIKEIRAKYSIPIVGMEPGVKPASINSSNKRIGLLATKGTLNGSLFIDTLKANCKDVLVYKQIGVGLVELIENDKIDSDLMRDKLYNLMQPMIDKKVDTLVLGCTHYNYLISILEEIFPYPIQIIETSNAVSRRINNVLIDNNLLSNKKHRKINITTTGELELTKRIINRLDLSKINYTINIVPTYAEME